MKNEFMTGMQVMYNLTADDVYRGTISKIFTPDKLPKDYPVPTEEPFYYELETDFEDLGVEKIIVPQSYIIGYVDALLNK